MSRAKTKVDFLMSHAIHIAKKTNLIVPVSIDESFVSSPFKGSRKMSLPLADGSGNPQGSSLAGTD